jgi:hypothetical protein
MLYFYISFYLYDFINIRITESMRMRWVGHVAHIEDMRNIFRILVVKPERRRTCGRLRSR